MSSIRIQKAWVLGFAALMVLLSTSWSEGQSEDRGFKWARPLSLEEMKAEKRVALVVGNGAYKSSPLKNPPNDARLMAETLRQAGFEVMGPYIDLDRVELQERIIDFGRKLRASQGVGLFFFAGHGMQVDGRNYIIPINARIEDEAYVKTRAVDVGDVLAGMEAANNRLNLVVLDACRNNPFKRSFRSSKAGLGSMDAPSGTMLLYATRPGNVASDGQGANGPFSQALARAILRPGLKLEDALKAAVLDVERETRGRQTPWLEGVIRGDFYFVLDDALAKEGGCPAGTVLRGGRCEPVVVNTECPAGFVFEVGRGCVPKVNRPATGQPDPSLKSSLSCAAGARPEVSRVDGNIHERCVTPGGVVHGLSIILDEHGNKLEEAQWRHGKRHGKRLTWSPDGGFSGVECHREDQLVWSSTNRAAAKARKCP